MEKAKKTKTSIQTRKNIKVRKWGKFIADNIIIAAASLIYSVGLHCFTAPSNIAPGGVVGVSIIVNTFLPVSVGTLYALINVPLIITGFKALGTKRMFKTVVSVAVITAATDSLFLKIPVYTGDKLLASIFGGVLFGIGLGLIYLREGTSGGIDIVNRIINQKRPHLRMGVIMLFSDAVVIAAAMLVFKSLESGLYALIAIFVSGRITDLILYGGLEGSLMFVFSDKYEDISRKILIEESRGVTLLNGVGAYSGETRNVICCAVSKNQYSRIKRKISDIDENAFIILTGAREVLGEGFNRLTD